MSTRTLGALTMVVAGALSSPALADEAAQETGAVTLSADANANANANRPRPAANRAEPRGNVGNLRILAGLHFGFGGELDVDLDSGVRLATGEPDLDPTVGLQAGVDYVLWKYFALGGELRLSWWKPERNIIALRDDPDRSLFVDIDIKPRGRYAFSNLPLEIYGTLPLGLSIASINDDIRMDGGAGFNLGFGAGATYFVTSRFGLNMELLGVWHWFDGEFDLANTDTDNRTAQFYWMLNGVFAI
jgi:hypothetical protein